MPKKSTPGYIYIYILKTGSAKIVSCDVAQHADATCPWMVIGGMLGACTSQSVYATRQDPMEWPGPHLVEQLLHLLTTKAEQTFVCLSLCRPTAFLG